MDQWNNGTNATEAPGHCKKFLLAWEILHYRNSIVGHGILDSYVARTGIASMRET